MHQRSALIFPLIADCLNPESPSAVVCPATHCPAACSPADCWFGPEEGSEGVVPSQEDSEAVVFSPVGLAGADRRARVFLLAVFWLALGLLPAPFPPRASKLPAP